MVTIANFSPNSYDGHDDEPRSEEDDFGMCLLVSSVLGLCMLTNPRSSTLISTSTSNSTRECWLSTHCP